MVGSEGHRRHQESYVTALLALGTCGYVHRKPLFCVTLQKTQSLKLTHLNFFYFDIMVGNSRVLVKCPCFILCIYILSVYPIKLHFIKLVLKLTSHKHTNYQLNYS